MEQLQKGAQGALGEEDTQRKDLNSFLNDLNTSQQVEAPVDKQKKQQQDGLLENPSHFTIDEEKLLNPNADKEQKSEVEAKEGEEFSDDEPEEEQKKDVEQEIEIQLVEEEKVKEKITVE